MVSCFRCLCDRGSFFASRVAALSDDNIASCERQSQALGRFIHSYPQSPLVAGSHLFALSSRLKQGVLPELRPALRFMSDTPGNHA